MDSSLNECGVCASESVVAFCENCNFNICETCFQMHKKSTKLFQNHVAFVFETTKTIIDASISSDDAHDILKKSVGDIHTHKCVTHTTENLVFYCAEHTETLCGRCVFSCHKLCRVVDLFEINVDDKEVSACRFHLQNVVEHLNSTEKKIEKNTYENIACKQEFLKDLQNLRTEVITWFDRLQLKCEKVCSETFQQNADRLTQVRTFCKANILRIQERQDLIDYLLTQNHVKTLYVLLNKLKQEIEDVQLKFNWLNSESTFNGYVFKRASGIEDLLNDHSFEIGGLDEWCSGSDEILDGTLSPLTVLRLDQDEQHSQGYGIHTNNISANETLGKRGTSSKSDVHGSDCHEYSGQTDNENIKPITWTQSGTCTSDAGGTTRDGVVARSTVTGVDVSLQKEASIRKTLPSNTLRPGDPLVSRMYETEGSEVLNPDNLLEDSCMWMYQTPTSIEHMLQKLESVCLNVKRYPVLQLFMKKDKILQALRFVPSILNLVRTLLNRYLKKIDTVEALHLNIRTIKTEIPVPDIHNWINAFAKAWEITKSSLNKHVCRTGNIKIAEFPKEFCSISITDETPLAVLLPSTVGPGLCSYAMLDFLFREQNAFLDDYIRMTGMNV